MQANRRVYRLRAVGRVLLTDCCGPDARFTVVETPRKGDPGSQPPGIGGMSVKIAWRLRISEWPAVSGFSPKPIPDKSISIRGMGGRRFTLNLTLPVNYQLRGELGGARG